MFIGYHHSGDDIHQVTPRKVAFSTEILQVVAIVGNGLVRQRTYLCLAGKRDSCVAKII